MSYYLTFLSSVLSFGAGHLFMALIAASLIGLVGAYAIYKRRGFDTLNLASFLTIALFSLLFFFGMLSPIFGPSNISNTGSTQALPALMLGAFLFFSTSLIAPAFSRKADGNKYRALSRFGIIAFAVAPLLYYALGFSLPVLSGPIVALASFIFMGASNRLEKAGIWSITTENYNTRELHFAALVYARESIAPIFLLIFGALGWSGFYSSTFEPIYLFAETFPGGYQWGLSIGFAASAYLLFISLGLALFFGALKYITARHSFELMLGLSNNTRKTSSLRGAKKSQGLQDKLDQQ
ncbi:MULTISPECIES: hypothetical protein [unclassified Thiomonas]|jgi:hypothetical protein|uniref:hypothetical protein n=1 Tax=unclassified Thiomonas TaxID=2625466 RepID=UPI00257D8F1A|nr:MULTISPECIES: hypothetical protein [unclassified Thiomonas]